MFSSRLFNSMNKSFSRYRLSSQKFIAVSIGIKSVPNQNYNSSLLSRIYLQTKPHKTWMSHGDYRLPRSIPTSFLRCAALSQKSVGLVCHARTIHTSLRRNALPPLVVIILRPIAQIAAILFGRSFRKWWAALPPKRKKAIVEELKKNILPILGFFAVLIGLGFHYYASHLEQDPITKRWRFIAFTPEQMLQIAKMELEVQIEEYRGLILKPSHPEYTRVVRVANRILKANQDLPGIKDKEWAVTVVGHPTERNAFVLPCGSIFIFTGMLDICDNDDQLGVIIAHEMSHAVLNHMAEQLSSVQLIEWLLLIPLVIIWAVLPDGTAIFSQWLSSRFANLMFHLPFSRAIENEADRVGLELAAKACFDVREATTFWSKMAALSKDNDEIEWLSTHPSHETREQILNKMMPSALQRRVDCNCPRLPYSDPQVKLNAFRKELTQQQKWEERLKKIS